MHESIWRQRQKAQGRRHRQRQKPYAEGKGRRLRAEGTGQRLMQKAKATLHESKFITFDSAWLVRAEAARP